MLKTVYRVNHIHVLFTCEVYFSSASMAGVNVHHDIVELFPRRRGYHRTKKKKKRSMWNILLHNQIYVACL